MPWHLIARIAVATLLGGVIGYERDLHGHPAGLRTHVVVALASATFMVISTDFVYQQHYAGDTFVHVDSSRIASSIVSGIGFLAGGTILRTGLTVQGLTTAAGLWLVSAIGMAAGAGMYAVGVAATALGVLTLTILRRLEDQNAHLSHVHVHLALDEHGSAEAIAAHLRTLGASVAPRAYDRELNPWRLSVRFAVELPRTLRVDRLLAELEAQPGVRRVRLED